jgi:hypothetical protein
MATPSAAREATYSEGSVAGVDCFVAIARRTTTSFDALWLLPITAQAKTTLAYPRNQLRAPTIARQKPL